jgi:hypothetical protein
MTTPKSWRISADNPPDLMTKFGTLGISVPDRTQPKDQFAEEVYCLRRYLFPLANAGFLEFSLGVVKQDPPDFMFAWHDARNTVSRSHQGDEARIDAAAIREVSRPVLVIPAGDCRAASFVLARVSRHIRDAEGSALFCVAAEYDDGLQALIDGDCAQDIQYLRASDSALQQSPDSEFFMSPEETR